MSKVQPIHPHQCDCNDEVCMMCSRACDGPPYRVSVAIFLYLKTLTLGLLYRRWSPGARSFLFSENYLIASPHCTKALEQLLKNADLHREVHFRPSSCCPCH